MAYTHTRTYIHAEKYYVQYQEKFQSYRTHTWVILFVYLIWQNRAEDLCVCEYTTLHAYHFGVCVCVLMQRQ